MKILYSKLRRTVSLRSSEVFDDLLRVALMLFVLKPAARFLSRRQAVLVARGCAAFMLGVSVSGNTARKTMKRAFLMKGRLSRDGACEYLAQPFVAYVVFERVLQGRERPEQWDFEEENSREVAQLRASGQSFVVAGGHFSRHAVFTMYLKRTTPGPLLASLGPLPDFAWKASTIRIRIQYGQMIRAIRHVRPDLQMVFAGANGAGRKILGHFKTQGANAIITADAFWDDGGSGGLTRPFTGHRAHTFATGAATVSRLVQCPVIPCVPYFRSDGTLVFKWGSLISPPDRARKEADIHNTNAIVDFFEAEVGCRPTQYVLYIGESRWWNSELRKWEDHEHS
jgi:lauroyl/myristoyl acyltransferase